MTPIFSSNCSNQYIETYWGKPEICSMKIQSQLSAIKVKMLLFESRLINSPAVCKRFSPTFCLYQCF